MDFELIECTGAEALTRLQTLRSEYAKTKKYPFLIGGERELASLRETYEYEPHDFEEILAAALKINAEEWFAARKKEITENLYDEEFVFDEAEIMGEWLGEFDSKGEVSIHKDIFTKEPMPSVFLGLSAVEQPWMILARTKYGGWNECPKPETHCALIKYWSDRYGAEVVGMSHDVIECTVKNPPTSEEAAMRLAWEQYLYCPDIVDQGVQTISNLAATIINSDYWYFWWD